MNNELVEKYNQAFNKMKKMGIFKRLPLCDIKNIHLSSYGYKFFNINYAECETLLNELDFKILKDIAGIMYISIDGLTNEFEPTIYINGSRSLALEDLNDEFVESLFNNANTIYKDAIILSRIYDIIWSRKRKYYKAAEIAFSNYNNLLFDAITNNNFHLAHDILPRMMVLAFYSKNQNIYQTMCDNLLKLSNLTITEDNLFFLYSVWNNIIKINWHDKRDAIYNQIANNIETHIYDNELSLNWQELCSNILCSIYAKLNNFDKQTEILEWIADKFIKISNIHTLPIQKYHLLSKAIEAYKRINKNPHKDKIEELYKQIQLLQKQKNTPYQLISHEIDISDQVKNVYEKYKEFDFGSCLYGLWYNKNFLPNEDKIKEIEKTSYSGFLTKYINCSYENHLGQTVLCTSENNNTYTLIKHYRHLFLEIYIVPILDIINEKFFYKKHSFEELVIYNPLIPEGYEELFLRGLYHFFKGYYIEAATILIPLLENSLRHILSTKYPMIYKENAQDVFKNHIDLTDLIKKVKEEKLLDEAIIYHLEDLITDPRYNIRNYIAHGLYPQHMFYSSDIILILYMIYTIIAESYFSKNLANIDKK